MLDPELIARLANELYAGVAASVSDAEAVPDRSYPGGIPLSPSAAPEPLLAQGARATNATEAGARSMQTPGELRMAGFPASEAELRGLLRGITSPYVAPRQPAAGDARHPRFYVLPDPAPPAPVPVPTLPLHTFDFHAVRRDFPLLHQEVDGRPLIWMDNAPTTHKPRCVMDAIALLRAGQLEHSPGRARAGGTRHRRLRARAREGAAVPGRPLHARDCLRPRHHRCRQAGGPELRRTESAAGRRNRADHARAPRQHRPLAVPGEGEGTAPYKVGVLSFVVEGIRPQDLGAFLDREGIAVRAGHHCAQPTMQRFNITGTVRPSLAFYNTREEIDWPGAAVRQGIRELSRSH